MLSFSSSSFVLFFIDLCISYSSSFSSSLLPVFLPCPHLLRLASNREMGERGGREEEEGGKREREVESGLAGSVTDL